MKITNSISSTLEIVVDVIVPDVLDSNSRSLVWGGSPVSYYCTGGSTNSKDNRRKSLYVLLTGGNCS
jgi:hypothetical protein